jgi:hypothetical protein
VTSANYISRSGSMPKQLRFPVDVINRVAPNLIGDTRSADAWNRRARHEALGAYLSIVPGEASRYSGQV